MRRDKHGSLLVRFMLISNLFPLPGWEQANHLIELESMHFVATPITSLFLYDAWKEAKQQSISPKGSKRHKDLKQSLMFSLLAGQHQTFGHGM